ncbi:MAG: hypothetical protein IIX99_03590, partial [Oscillospiraceae bacterium]|nr:hypothetical protein [Oscillospiraceae bacterium]
MSSFKWIGKLFYPCLLIATLAISVSAAENTTEFAGSEGTEASPHLIANATGAEEQKTYVSAPETGITIKLLPSERAVQIQLDSTWISAHNASFAVGALYADKKMIGCTVVELQNSVDPVLELSYSGEQPPRCGLFLLNENYVPIYSAFACDLFNQAYSLEDGTFFAVVLTSTYNEALARLKEELSVLEGQKATSEATITQAEIDLINLPNKKNAYIQSRISYYMSSGSPGSR